MNNTQLNILKGVQHVFLLKNDKHMMMHYSYASNMIKNYIKIIKKKEENFYYLRQVLCHSFGNERVRPLHRRGGR